MIKGIVIYIGSVFIASISQLLLKVAATKGYKSIRIYLNAFVVMGYILLLCSMLLTIFALKGLDVKYAPVLEASGYFFVALLSRLVLKEDLQHKKVMGILLIIFGICVYCF